MQEQLSEAWGIVWPIIELPVWAALAALAVWGANLVRRSAWYKSLPWPMRWAVDRALKIAVVRLQPSAEALKDASGGKLLSADADMLREAAKAEVLETLATENPAVFRAGTAKVEAVIEKRVPAIVEKVKKNRRDFSRPGTKGGR